jgi:hypothetical protein
LALTKITEGIIADGAVPTTGIVGVSTFTSSGTWTKATRESALGVTIKRVIVEVQGAGGSGYSSNAATGVDGGGGGGYAKKIIDVSLISSATITVGSGGAPVNLNNAGNAGGNSVWSDGTNTVTGNGGSGGLGGGYTPSPGGTGIGGDINITGQSSWPYPFNDQGGGSVLGFGSFYEYVGQVPANDPRGYGGGAGGVFGKNGVTSGGDGIVIVTEIAG